MAKNKDFYEIIRGIISRCQAVPYDKELIKAEIMKELQVSDYPSAIVSYLWGAYYNLDGDAQKVFLAGVFFEMKEQYPSLYDFFSFYFQNNTRRRGFDRRLGENRRKSYSLDYYSGKFIERRSKRERRKSPETREGWTRLDQWISVPFEPDEAFAGQGMGMRPPAQEGAFSENDFFRKEYISLYSIEIILTALTAYFESYMQPGQTAWKDVVSPETLRSAETVMKRFIAMLAKGQNVNAK
ncbi:MAG: hypothetical protein M0P74_02645 [Syntrophales bacterium]|jgi:hypothetical protein|nr:hypothetical protein [Syntrophales bacterium]